VYLKPFQTLFDQFCQQKNPLKISTEPHKIRHLTISQFLAFTRSRQNF
jgi:hypothetical protein